MKFGSRRIYTTMSSKLRSSLLPRILLLSLLLLIFYSTLLRRPISSNLASSSPPCDLFSGRWVFKPESPKPSYDETCPFHRNAWNCLKNKRENMDVINSWKWAPEGCELNRIDPIRFLGLMRNKNIGFVGDSLNENFVVSFLCTLRVADPSAVKWKKKKAWRGAYFPKFNVTVAYHRAVLLAKYQSQPRPSEEANQDGVKRIYRVDVDVPADEWINVTSFYDVLIFNSGHWWGYDKFPKETPLVFYRKGKPINPPLDIMQGFEVVLKHMVSYIQREVPSKKLKFWRLQSPRHFYGGDWNQNGSCLLDKPLNKNQLDLWFDPRNNGVNKEARSINGIIKNELQQQTTEIKLLDVTHLSEFRADAHPAIWLGKQDAVAIWGQDCMHWCLPGVPDTWVDILAELIIINNLKTE